MTYKVKNIQYRIQLDTDKNIFIVFDAKNESKTATGHTTIKLRSDKHFHARPFR